MTINIAGQTIDLADPRLDFRLGDASPEGARIVATIGIDIGNRQKIEVGRHSEAISNSAAGRARLAEYPKQVQGWLIPGIWGDEPTVTEKEEKIHGV